MFRGYNFNVDLGQLDNVEYFYEIGKKLYLDYKKSVTKKMESFSLDEGELNASLMQENWFPTVDAHVFISHSHKNEKLAITFSGFLYDCFKIKSFIDSCAWGYSNDLLRLIDDKYCNSESGETYNYQKRNASTSHVHMMLSTALLMMIDKAECVLFINTPDSISPKKVIQNSTGSTTSPWIYSEIAMTKFIRQKSLDEHRGFINKNIKEASVANALLPNMWFGLSFDHFVDLDIPDIENWVSQFEGKSSDPHDALDLLYELKMQKS